MKITHISPLCFCISVIGLEHQRQERREMKEWIEQNIERTYFIRGVYITFRSKHDAMAFKMRWL